MILIVHIASHIDKRVEIYIVQSLFFDLGKINGDAVRASN